MNIKPSFTHVGALAIFGLALGSATISQRSEAQQSEVQQTENQQTEEQAPVTETPAVGELPPTTELAPVDLPFFDLPSPKDFVSSLDLECRRASPVAPPVNNIHLTQLNPVLDLPDQNAQLGALQDVCVPVAKNENVPPPSVLQFTRWVDLACFRAAAEPVEVEVHLSHLNPELAQLDDVDVKINRLSQLCVPVAKNNVIPPASVRRLVQHIDLACYQFDDPVSYDTELQLTHLNPVIAAQGFEDRMVRFGRGNRLCVPVAKTTADGQQDIPADVLEVVEWIDMLKLRTRLLSDQLPALPLQLTHLNPLFGGLSFNTTLVRPLRLMVPVAKDGHTPPSGSDPNF